MGLLVLAAGGAIASSGCSSESSEVCISDEQYFAEKVWAPILNTKCVACHNPQGQASETSFVLRSSSEAGFLDTNMQIFKDVASLERNGQSLVLLKPTLTIQHGGGQVIPPGGPEYQALNEMVNRFKAPSECETDVNAFFADLVLASPKETLRMAALELAGRLPTETERKVVEDSGLGGLDAVLDQYMKEEAFYVRLKEIYNDYFLTDRYLNNEDAVNLLNSDVYDPQWYYAMQDDPSLIEYYGAESHDDLIDKLARWTNVGVGREPLELIAHVVRNDRPFTEILTADYMMVNPFSARAYNMYDLEAQFQNPADANEFIEARREGIPHAGVLSSPMWLNRFPTTPTNRNRHRARMVYQFFLGTDILKTAEQPLDSTTITDFNPTMNNKSCTVCHAQIDFVAGAFHNYSVYDNDEQGDEQAFYDPASNWLEDMRPPGFAGESVPFEMFPEALPWLGQRVATHPGFALAAVYAMFSGLTGQKPLLPPASTDDHFSLRFQAYLGQYHTFNAIAHKFIESDYDLKVVVKEIIKSPFFRARNFAGQLTPERELALQPIIGTRFLTPEQLHRKVWAVMGYPWRPEAYDGGGGSYDYLLRDDAYKLLYGGIDSADVIQRITAPNGIMANIADRLANDMSCLTVPRDFQLPTGERLLFPMVEQEFEPKDANGFEVIPAVQAIKANIVFLHERLLGETLSVDDPEVERTYQLFVDTWQEGRDGMAIPEGEEGHINPWLNGRCQVHEEYWTRTPLAEEERLTDDETYTIRAWMAVTSYLLSDFRFIYQ